MSIGISTGERSHHIVGIKVNGEPMLTWGDRICDLLGELFPRVEPLVFSDDRAEGAEEIPPLS